MRASRALLLLALTSGCARSTIVRPRAAPAPSMPPVATSPAPEVPPVPGRLRRSTYGSPGRWWIDAHGDPRRALVDGWRAELRGATVTGADGWIDSPLVAAWRDGERWHFAGRAEHWVSESFLGRATRVASVAQGALGLGGGRVVRLLHGTAEGLGLPTGFVLDAAFADPTRGVAIVEPGVVLRTDDGGRGWSPVPLADDVPRELVASSDSRWVRGDRGCFVLDGDALRSRPCTDLPLLTDANALPDDAREPFVQARAARFDWVPVAFTDRSRRRLLVGMPSESERRPSSSAVWVYDLERDEMVAGSEGELPCTDRLVRAFTADRAYVVCRGTEQTHQLWSRGDDGRWSLRLEGGSCAEDLHCAASASGARVACTGTCAEGGACATGGTFCERIGVGAARSWSVGSDVRAWRLGGYDGETLVLLDQRVWLAHAEVILDHAPPVPLLRGTATDGLRMTGDPRVGSDGLLRFWASHADDGEPVALEGHPGGTFAVREAPPWARPGHDPSFHYCGADGVAWAEAPDRMPWRSREAGEPWEPLLPDGSAYAALLRAEVAGRSSPAWCDAIGWIVHGNARLRAAGWGPIEAPRAAPDLVAREVAEPGRFEVVHTWQCRQDGPDRSRNETTGYPTTLGPFPGLVRATRDGAFMTVWDFRRVTVDHPAPMQFRYRDAPHDEAFRWEDAPHTLWADAQRALLLVPRGNEQPREWRSRLLELSATAPPRWLDELPSWSRSRSYYGPASTLTAQAGDTIAALSSVAMSDTEAVPTVAVGFLSMRRGSAPQAQRVVVNARGAAPGVFVLDGRAGVVRWGADGSLVGGPPNELPRVLARRASPSTCGPAARGAFVLPSSVALEGFDDERAIEEYALDGEVACLRAVRSQWSVLGPAPTGLVGVHRGGTRLRCTPR